MKTPLPQAEPERDPVSGQVIAETYRVRRRIGGGAMGSVFEAEHLRLNKLVALKCLRWDLSNDRQRRARFAREARTLASLSSEHIVAVFDLGELESGLPYLVMERLEGEDLRSLLKTAGSFSVARASRIAHEVCQALTVVHDAGLVHRDLKPTNLFMAQVGRRRSVCKLLDFGVVKVLTEDATRDGSVIGTIRYMAPEQLRNSAKAGPQADIYALGAILYELLSGRSPHDGASDEELAYAVLHQPAPRLRTCRPEVPAAVEQIVARALDPEPARRFQSASELASALAPFAFQSEPALMEAETSLDTATSASTTQRSGRRRKRLRAAFLLAGMVVAGTAASTAARTNTRAKTETPKVLALPAPTCPPTPPAPVCAASSALLPVHSSPSRGRRPATSGSSGAAPPTAPVKLFDESDPYAD